MTPIQVIPSHTVGYCISLRCLEMLGSTLGENFFPADLSSDFIILDSMDSSFLPRQITLVLFVLARINILVF